MKLEQLLLLDEMIKESHLEKLCTRIYNKTIQLIKIHNEDHIHFGLTVATIFQLPIFW